MTKFSKINYKTMRNLHKYLIDAAKNKNLPALLAYNRIDGPGSSLDLREFQQTFWTLPKIPKISSDQEMKWSRSLPRTVGITINTGTKIHAEPYDPEMIAIQSIEYGTEVSAKYNGVIPIKENWLLKILELFGLKGVKFVLHNIRVGIQSSGLGGSATATTGVCLLANELAGRPFNNIQLVSLASRIEQDYGVSITGTQEQSNVIFGGVCDYVWFPWGIPKKNNTGYGTSIRTELIPKSKYRELESRLAIFHTGKMRASMDVNSAWVHALSQKEGYLLHKLKLEIAYQFREGLRLSNWKAVSNSINEYKEVRTELCSAYMDGANEINGFALERGCVTFPLGAGGGGGILVFSTDPKSILKLRHDIKEVYREIPISIKSMGHEFINL